MTAAWSPGPGVVALPDGRTIRGRGLRAGSPRGTPPPGPLPDFSLCLTFRRPSLPWTSRWVRWPDFGLPWDSPDAVAAIGEAYDRAATSRVEIVCGGGVGRTGTAIALLAVLGGVPPDRAVGWTRTHYHRRAAETPWQRRWVLRTGRAILAGR